jgi:hypothetical protein
MKYAIRGLLLGLVVGFLVYLAERTTGNVLWPLALGFPISWAIAGYLFWHLDIGGYRSESEAK